MWVTQPEGILSDRPSFEWVQVGQFHLLKLTFSNNVVPDSMQPLHMQVKWEFLQLLLKKLNSQLALVKRSGESPKLRPQKNLTMFTNMKRVY